MTILNKIGMVLGLLFGLYLASIPVRIAYDNIKNGWFNKK